MASKKTLNAKNLQALGAERLAELLIEISQGNGAAKRRLRLELAGTLSPDEVAREVRKRLATIARSRSFVDWQARRALIADLEVQRRAIVDQVAKSDPVVALDLMWRFLSLSESLFERCDDSNGTVSGALHAALGSLGDIAVAARVDPGVLAERVFAAVKANHYGQYDDLIGTLAPALGPTGLEHLKRRVVELSKQPVTRPPEGEREVIGWGHGGPLYADEIAARRHEIVVRRALQEIADAQGDVDAFIAQHSDEARTAPAVASKIARRLLAAGRAEEAWTAINAAGDGPFSFAQPEWEGVRLEVLEALGRGDEAQAFRWTCFERTLSARHLRAYLERLPDFEDFEAEQRAFSLALAFPAVDQALALLVPWPALDKAAELVIARAEELDGDHYEILSPAADALAAKYPLAATILLRAMIDFSLGRSRTGRYRHAARHLAECAGLASAIEDFCGFETHQAYCSRLDAEHGRKSSFWSLVS